MYRSWQVFAITLALVAVPAATAAQHVSVEGRPWYDRFTLEPYAGAYFDNADPVGSGFGESGWLGGLRLGLALSDRVRLIGDAGYSRVDEATRVRDDGGSILYGSENWLLTGGVEADVVPGDTRGSLSIQAGNVWRELREQERVGSPWVIPLSAEFSPVHVLVPGFTIHQRVTPRGDLSLGARDYIFFPGGDESVSHNFALTLGITLR